VTAPEPGGALARAVESALGAEGPVARAHPGYLVRPGQVALAVAVADAIEGTSRLVAEAGTGTGKTFAYLVPALLSGARILVSTGTRNLQDQLFGRDLPELARVLGVRVDAALLKGRANYVCWHHLQRNLADGRFARREDIAQLHRIQRFAAVSQTGDRSELQGVPEDAPAWSMATSTRDNCLGQECPEFSRCFVFRARQAAQRADVVVVNHHLFCADLALRDEGVADLLPTADALIFDEAHQLPEVATQFFGSAVSSRRLLDFSRDMLRAGLSEARDAADWTGLSREIEQAVRVLRLEAGLPGRLDVQAVRARRPLLAAIEGCEAALARAGQVLSGAAERGRELQRCALRALELRDQMLSWRCAALGQPVPQAAAGPPGASSAGPASEPHAESSVESSAESSAESSVESSAESSVESSVESSAESPAARADEPVVIWAEVHGAGVTLHTTPLSVAGVFRRHLAARPRGWVFLSATLAVAGKVDHFVDAMGLDDARLLVWDSPFDYAAQGLLYVPQGIGDPAGADFPDRVFDASWPLIAANRGRAFVLCTTLRMVDRLATLAQAAIDADQDPAPDDAGAAPSDAHAAPIELLVQGRASRAELIDRFRAGRAPLLIGSASFWEGVDVPGRQLSLVVIDKLPFAPPDEPVLRARIDAARRAGEDPFRSMQLPAAAMALKQGAGRLIRSESDRGVLLVCDARLAEKAYGRLLLRSLPPFRRTRSRDEALAFLAQMP